ncbi:MAG: hypothetical protein HFH99_11870 [Lachnospiraceae bacterium]|nr:hypothetical protein [uncultured Acetatifactor sp.]MCI8697452.1 hypothetical protein [Lachnospiraceae bacterium]MCI9650890.1 hypothetical protein [Lachnospiraceae bacterium]
MATSSITKNFIISDEKQIELFANAIEESYEESLRTSQSAASIKFRELQNADEIKEIMEKWRKSHE